MKAADYYAKYKEGLIRPDGADGKSIAEMLTEMKNESVEIMRQRKCARPSTVASVIREMNQKYNAVVRLAEKDAGYPPLVQNGFLIIFKEHYAEMFPGIGAYL